MKKIIVIVGGGAAGIFAAAILGEKSNDYEIIVLEKTRQLLSKVRISGGGRCNVTHAQFDPKQLTGHYPRGHKELLGPFHRFQPQDTIAWFAKHGVELKTEEDGRMFPITDHSATIINCLLEAAKEGGVDIRTEHSVRTIEKQHDQFLIHFDKREMIACDYLILACGSSPQGHELAASLGHTITPPVPSLFTFNVPTSPLHDLAGISVPHAKLSLLNHTQRGPLLITHWGFSGPAALKLSAWAARELHTCNYRTELCINWIPHIEHVHELLLTAKRQKSTKPLENVFQLPMNLWKRVLTLCNIDGPLGHVPDHQLKILADWLTHSRFSVDGKTTYKQEFVTCGGVNLKEIDFKTMQSRLTPNLFFAGELLDIDGVTGGFNFQNAWTSAFLAASHIANL